MSTNIGPRIGIDGYASYKAEMQSIIAQIQNYKAQCDALSNSEEDLRKKQQLQAEQIKLQTDLLMKQAEWNEKVRQTVDSKRVITERDTAVLQANETALLNQETELTKLASEYDKTTAQLDKFGNEQQEAGDNAEDTSDKVSAATIALGELMAKVVEKGAQLVKQAAELGIEYNASMETYTAAFSTLLGSTEEAEAAISNIRELSKGIPTFSTTALVKATQMLVATGKSAEVAEADVKALANAVAASGGGNSQLERMAQNLQQIGNAGKATQIDIRQFAYAGINVYKVLADYTGKTTEEIKDMTVTYDMLTAALRYAASEGGIYFGGLEAQANTYNGQISALKKNIEENLGYVFEKLTSTLETSLLPKLNEFLSDTGNIDKVVNLIEDFGIAAVTFSTASKFTEFLTKNKTAVALLTGQITAAEAATTLWSSALSAMPYTVAAAGVTLLVTGIKNYNKAVNTIRDENIIEPESVEEANEHIAEMKRRIEELEGIWPEFRTQEQQQEIDGLNKAIKETKTQIEELQTAEQEITDYTESSEVELQATIDKAKMAMDELKAAYDEAYASAMTAALKQFDLFEAVGELAYTSTQDLGANLESQTAYWDGYAANLNYLADSQYGLSQELISFLSDGSTESAGYLASIVSDIAAAGGLTSEAGQQIVQDLNGKFGQLQEAQEGYANEAAAALTDIEAQMNTTVDNAIAKLNELNLSDEMYANGVSTINGYASGITAETPGLQTQAFLLGQSISSSVQAGINSVRPVVTFAGSGSGIVAVQGSHAKGLDYVPEDNYIAALHKGEMVLTAAQANAVRSGAYQQSITNKALNYGGVNINIYPKDSDDADAIADKVAAKLQHGVTKKEAVYR